MKKRSRALSPLLLLSDRVQCVVAAGGGGWLEEAPRPVYLHSKNDEEGCFSSA